MANTSTFDAKFKEALPLYEKLKNEWNRKPPNVGKTDELLNALKVSFSSSITIDRIFVFLIQNLFAEGGFYPSDSSEDTRGLHIARDTLEIAAQCAINKEDIPAFERALAQLKPFYFDLGYVDLIFFLFIVNLFLFLLK